MVLLSCKCAKWLRWLLLLDVLGSAVLKTAPTGAATMRAEARVLQPCFLKSVFIG
jgi:hypothetical protein